MVESSEKPHEKGQSETKKIMNRTAEIDSIGKVADALGEIDRAAQIRVLNYVIEMLGLRDSFGGPSRAASPVGPSSAPVQAPQSLSPIGGTTTIQDIRSLKEQKAPTTAVEMTAVAAYYLSESAPQGDRSDSIGVDELKRLFKQAGYPLPPKPHMTLVHSKNAGYFDSVSPGRYRLNPVGYNLVAHGLPSGKGRGKAK